MLFDHRSASSPTPPTPSPLRRKVRSGLDEVDRLLKGGGLQPGRAYGVWDRTAFVGTALAETVVDGALARGCAVGMAAAATEFRAHDRGVSCPPDRRLHRAEHGAYWLTDLDSHDARSLARAFRRHPAPLDLVVVAELNWLAARPGPVPTILAELCATGTAVLLVAHDEDLIGRPDLWRPGSAGGGGPSPDFQAAVDELVEVLAHPNSDDTLLYEVRTADGSADVRFQPRFRCAAM
jgi:hypothetical protein